MAQLEVNNERFDLNPNHYLNLKSLLPKLQKTFSIDQNELTQLKINGIDIDINGEDPSLVRPINDSDYIQIKIAKRENTLNYIANDISDLLNKISSKISSFVLILNSSDSQHGLNDLEKIVDAVNIFVQAISYVIKSSTDSKEIILTLPIRDLKIHLLSVMKAIETAHNTKDYIMLSDLLEYELQDNLTKWKILVIPTIRKQIRKEF